MVNNKKKSIMMALLMVSSVGLMDAMMTSAVEGKPAAVKAKTTTTQHRGFKKGEHRKSSGHMGRHHGGWINMSHPAKEWVAWGKILTDEEKTSIIAGVAAKHSAEDRENVKTMVNRKRAFRGSCSKDSAAVCATKLAPRHHGTKSSHASHGEGKKSTRAEGELHTQKGEPRKSKHTVETEFKQKGTKSGMVE